jgi:hypothetical protein
VRPTLSTRAGLNRSWNTLPTADKGTPANQDQSFVERFRKPYQTPEYPHGEASGTRAASQRRLSQPLIET